VRCGLDAAGLLSWSGVRVIVILAPCACRASSPEGVSPL